jgi:sulfite exporter TauE/SafE/copper chaperone CopZ
MTLRDKFQDIRLRVRGMTCVNCAEKIKRGLLKLPGVERADVRFQDGTARVTYDPAQIREVDLVHAVEAAGYAVGGNRTARQLAQGAASIAAVALVYLLLNRVGAGALAGALPLAEAGMGYGMLFVIGLITSVHCVVMCGGINMSQCMGAGGANKTRTGAMKPSLMYNLGRVAAYTVIGGIVGAVGSVISLSSAAKGAVQIAAGVFMVIMGLNMTGLFPWLSRLVPRMPAGIAGKLKRGGGSGPFTVGLINGLMPCGPLQAMQLYALSTGNALAGALSMFLFSLGTVPLMFALGAMSSMMSHKFSKRAMAVGAVLVAALGLSMLTSGLNLTGVSIFPAAKQVTASAEQTINSAPQQTTDSVSSTEGVQKVRTTLASGRYEPITVTAGVPVEWTIDAPKGSINGCNNRMVIPEYGIEYAFQPGENVIRFTPDEAGTYPYTCWMGMISSAITVLPPG